MKVNTYLKIGAFILVLVALVVSCQEETFENEQHKELNRRDFTVYIENTAHLRKNNPTLYKKIENALEASKTPQKENTTTAISLDLEEVQIIEKSTYTQYTLKVVHPESETLLINYMLLDFNDGQQYQYLIKYPKIITEGQIALDHTNIVIEKIEGDALYQGKSIGGSRPCLDGVPEIVDTYQTYGCTQYKCGGDGHVLGEQCNCGITINCKRAYEECGWTTVNIMGCSGGGPSGSGTGTGTSGGGNSNDNDDDDEYEEPIEIIPFVPNWQRVVDCVNNGFYGSLDANNPLPLSTDDINWLQTLVGGIQASAIVNFMNNNGCSENKEFIDEAIEALRNGGEVDFEEEIIMDSTFVNHQRLKCIYDKFKNGNNKISNYLNNFLPDNAVAHLNFKADNNFKTNYTEQYWGAGAVTEPPLNTVNGTGPANYNIGITFNTDSSLTASAENVSTIILAVELIHEMVHAEMFRKLMECAQLPHVNFQQYVPSQWRYFINNLRNDFPGLYDYYARYRFGTSAPGGEQHNLMASHYRGMMVEALKEFDNNQHTDEFYNKIAWTGLKGTTAWNNLTPEERTAIDLAITNAINNETHECTN